MSRVLAIDPGNTHSGWAVIDATDCRPLSFNKDTNHDLLHRLRKSEGAVDLVAVEMVASYGMAVGREVFETCVWIGRFTQAVDQDVPWELVYRRDVKLHHCGQTKANDSNIAQALKDRFAPGVRNHGKGTKANPGWFYGFSADIWQAYALAVLVADRIEGRAGVAA